MLARYRPRYVTLNHKVSAPFVTMLCRVYSRTTSGELQKYPVTVYCNRNMIPLFRPQSSTPYSYLSLRKCRLTLCRH